MRGAQRKKMSKDDEAGIIPADAGSTDMGMFRSVIDEDHPRGCGEHLLGLWVADMINGSSPRMRGAPHARQARSRWTGIIPADAGSTDEIAVHTVVQMGSSPRMRGALHVRAEKV